MVPVLSRLTAEPERYRDVLLRTLGQLTLAIWPGIIWSIVLADILVPTLLGKQWTESAAIFRPLAIAGLVQVVNYANGCMYISQGRSGEFARWSFLGAAVDVASFLIGLPFGAVGVATAYAISEYLRTPLLWWLVTRRGPIKGSDVVQTVLPQFASVLASLVALFAYRTLVQLSPIFLLAGGLVLSYAITALVMSLSPNGRKTMKQSLEAGRRILRHIKSKDEN
jgi:PST family polysaccharide transporter